MEPTRENACDEMGEEKEDCLPKCANALPCETEIRGLSSLALREINRPQAPVAAEPGDEQGPIELRRRKGHVATEDKCLAAEWFFTDYYMDLLTYLAQRRQRLGMFHNYCTERGLDGEAKETEWQRYCGQERAMLRRRRTRCRVNDFQILAQIGRGGYGEVFLCRQRDNGVVCALKKMKKAALMIHDEARHVANERNVLGKANSEWIVRLLSSFQDAEHLYLSMEYVPGGDMRTLLQNCGVLHEAPARFYMIEMVHCVSTLHGMGFIHRDLKPENFLIDRRGHLKLTDFGLAKGRSAESQRLQMRQQFEELAARQYQTVSRTSEELRALHRSVRAEDAARAHSLVGSPDYMAPEMLKSKDAGSEYDLRVDYWALGCILFEFLSTYPPFTGASVEEVWVNVLRWKQVLARPWYPEEPEFNFSDQAWDLVMKLIAEPGERWHRVSQICEHAFFTPDRALWRNIRELDAPFVPDLGTDVDHRYFDASDDLDSNDAPKEAAINRRAGRSGHNMAPPPRDLFLGWTYKARSESQIPVSDPGLQEMAPSLKCTMFG